MTVALTRFAAALKDVIGPDDRLVVIYSGIWTFGARLGGDPVELPGRLNDLILEVCGPERTVLLPTYTNYFTRTGRFDYRQSPPETGVLPTEWLTRAGVVRTRCPMNSFGALGPAAGHLSTLRPASLWGPGSVKEHLEQVDARIVMLGLPWGKACGFLHRMEEVAQVPYRYYKRFPGVWIEADQERPVDAVMYVRPLGCEIDYRWERVDQQMRSKGLVIEANGEFPIESARAADIVRIGAQMLQDDPYALMSNAVEMRDWVMHRKAEEVAALAPNNRVDRR